MQTLGAASGFTPSDSTGLTLRSETDALGTFRRQMAQFGGDSRAADLRNSVTAHRVAGDNALRQARFGAANTIIGGVSTLFRRYG